jgi:hypothetical protein
MLDMPENIVFGVAQRAAIAAVINRQHDRMQKPAT